MDSSTEHLWDLVTIGGGPAGLICSITAMSGVPIDPPRHFSALVLDKGEIGQFAKYGKLRITHRWHWMGDELIGRLVDEAERSGIELREGERVVGVELDREPKLVRTARATYRARSVALCPGFFPHGELMRFPRGVRPIFSPPGLEARVIRAAPGETIVLLGAGSSTVSFALELARLRPELRFLLVLEAPAVDVSRARAAGQDVRQGRVQVRGELPEGVELELLELGARRPERRRARLLLVDYNSYTSATTSTDFLAAAALARRRGYLAVDDQGRTSVAGVVAAGNVTTAVSGVLTALSTGFTAGLSLHRYLTSCHFGAPPDHFPWLPREGLAAHPLGEGDEEDPVCG